MFTIDEIRIEGEEDGFHLIIYMDDGPTPQQSNQVRYRIGLPDQFHAEVQRTIGRWLSEGEIMRGFGFTDDDIDYQRVHPGPKNSDLARDIKRGK